MAAGVLAMPLCPLGDDLAVAQHQDARANDDGAAELPARADRRETVRGPDPRVAGPVVDRRVTDDPITDREAHAPRAQVLGWGQRLGIEEAVAAR